MAFTPGWTGNAPADSDSVAVAEIPSGFAAKLPVPSTVPPTENVTLPVGATKPAPAALVTIALRVVTFPAVTIVGLAVRATVTAVLAGAFVGEMLLPQPAAARHSGTAIQTICTREKRALSAEIIFIGVVTLPAETGGVAAILGQILSSPRKKS